MKFLNIKNNKLPLKKTSLKKKNKGFTLVESLLAIMIFTVSVSAMIVILGGGLTSTSYAKNKIIASYLAQEGVEYMRNLRDTYVLYQPFNTNGWDDFKNKLAPCDSVIYGSCYFDDQLLNYSDPSQPITDITITTCSNSGCPPLLYNSTTGKYGYASGEDMGFVRSIQVVPISPLTNDEIKIVSTVSFKSGSKTQNVSFSESLFNWTK